MVLGTSSEYALANTLLTRLQPRYSWGVGLSTSAANDECSHSPCRSRRRATGACDGSLRRMAIGTASPRMKSPSRGASRGPRRIHSPHGGDGSERQARYRADGGCRKSWRGAPEAIGRERSHQSIEGWPAADRAGSVRLSLGRGARRCGRLRHPKRQGPPTIVLLTVDVSSQQRLDSGGSRILAHRPDPRCSSRATVPRAAPCAGRSRSPVGTTTVARPCIASGVSAKKGVGTRSSTKACETTTVHRSPLQRPEQ